MIRTLGMRWMADAKLRASKCLAASYHSLIMDHSENPRNIGSMDKNDKNVGTGLVGAPACGDVLKLQIRVDCHGTIVETKHKVFGCGTAIAASSISSEWIKNKDLEEASQITNRDIANYLHLPPVKLHCSMLSEDAIKAAITDYKKKNNYL